MLEIGLPRLRMSRLFPASPGAQLQQIAVSTVSIQLGPNKITIPDRMEKNLRSWICSPLKKCLSVRSHQISPRKCWKIGLPRLRISRRFLQDLSRAVCRFSSGLVAGNHRQHFFDPTGSSAIQSPIGSKKKITCSFYPTTRRQ